MTGAEFRAHRIALGLRQRELALLLGYSAPVRISEIESGAWQPSGAVLRLLMAYVDGYRPPDWPIRL